MKKPLRAAREAAEMLAVQALTFIAEDQERMSGFLAATGLEPGQIRAAAQQEGFFAGVLEHCWRRKSPRCVCRQRRNRSCRDCARPRRARPEMGARPAVSAFCRDCLVDAFAQARRCGACGSPRIVRHDELAKLSIAHVDCDAFYATIEKRDDPTLAAEPVSRRRPPRRGRGRLLRGAHLWCALGHADVRGAAALPARARGAAEHGEICAHRARGAADDACAHAHGRAVVDRRGLPRSHRHRALAQPLARQGLGAVCDRSGEEAFDHRFGRISCNKFLAKIASDLDKPRGFAVLSATEAPDFLAPKPVAFIFGVGKVSAARLARDGFARIADLQKVSEVEMMRRYGEEGRRLARLSRGIDTRNVSADRETKSVSSETTLTATSPTSARSSASSGRRPRKRRRVSRKRRSPAPP